MTYEEMKAVADEAHLWGLKVAAHAHGASGIREAIRAGVDTIEHASLIDDAGIRLARPRGAWPVDGYLQHRYTQSEGRKNGVLGQPAQGPRVADIQRENFFKAHQAGVRMVYGTDAGIYPHGDNARASSRGWCATACGPPKAIRTATLNAAGGLGRADPGRARGRARRGRDRGGRRSPPAMSPCWNRCRS